MIGMDFYPTSIPAAKFATKPTADASYKYVFFTRDNTEKLFELRNDPAEQINLIQKAKPALLAFLRSTRLQRFTKDRIEGKLHEPKGKAKQKMAAAASNPTP